MKPFNMNDAMALLEKWKNILRLKDWEIEICEVDKEWRKSADIKIDRDDKQAILMVNNLNPKILNLESLIVHELLHLKLWGMDQMIEELINLLFGNDETDAKYQFAFSKFMEVLEPTVEDLAKSFMSLGGDSNYLDFGRVQTMVDKELNN